MIHGPLLFELGKHSVYQVEVILDLTNKIYNNYNKAFSSLFHELTSLGKSQVATV